MTERLLGSEPLPPALASAVAGHRTITIRDARSTDGDALRRLEQLAECSLATADLLGLVDGELVAAVSANGEVVSDPFIVTVDVVELLELRSQQLRAAA